MATSKSKKSAATKTATSKKAAPKKTAAAPAPAAAEVKEPGKIAQIIALHLKGKSNKEIIEAGFNKTTVGIQVAKFKKSKAEKKK